MAKLEVPRAVWIMVRRAARRRRKQWWRWGKLLQAGDTIIDGGNSFYKNDVRRSQMLATESGIHYIDVGTSGGVWGA